MEIARWNSCVDVCGYEVREQCMKQEARIEKAMAAGVAVGAVFSGCDCAIRGEFVPIDELLDGNGVVLL